jgi:hypothetical protein
MKMKGYVKNTTHLWAHAMKRSVGPGGTISLQELYEQYGKKHDLKPGKEFTKWLQDVKLRDQDRWQILNEEGQPFGTAPAKAEKKEVEDEAKTSNVVVVDKAAGDNVVPIVIKDMEIADVVALSVRKAREVVPGILDIQLLKYAEREANQLAGKDSLRRILRKRIQELEVSNRR